MAVDHAAVTGGDPTRLRSRLGIPQGRAVIGQLGVNDINKGTNDTVLAVARLNAARSAQDSIHLLLGGASSPAFEAFTSTLCRRREARLSILGPAAPKTAAISTRHSYSLYHALTHRFVRDRLP